MIFPLLLVVSCLFGQEYFSIEGGTREYIPEAEKRMVTRVSNYQGIKKNTYEFNEAAFIRKDYEPLPVHGFFLEIMKNRNRYSWGGGAEYTYERYVFTPERHVYGYSDEIANKTMNWMLYAKALAHLHYKYRPTPFAGIMAGLLVTASGYSEVLPMYNRVYYRIKRKKKPEIIRQKKVYDFSLLHYQNASASPVIGLLCGLKMFVKQRVGGRITVLYTLSPAHGRYKIQDYRATKNYFDANNTKKLHFIENSPVFKNDYSGLSIYLSASIHLREK
ncbi:MAG: hypothetical protein A2096_11020 [Spirochaetes bacterium GWF1_41_5]|nr:MAG: hypothetical protein A2096_11020 [Spirochaetes bacterium GWF1_41_5]HBE01747.1 hypothetical protein [Spirochaetia bacterium]